MVISVRKRRAMAMVMQDARILNAPLSYNGQSHIGMPKLLKPQIRVNPVKYTFEKYLLVAQSDLNNSTQTQR